MQLISWTIHKCLLPFPNSTTVTVPCSHGFGDSDPSIIPPLTPAMAPCPWSWVQMPVEHGYHIPSVLYREVNHKPLSWLCPKSEAAYVFSPPTLFSSGIPHLPTHSVTSSSSGQHISPETPRPTHYSTSSKEILSPLWRSGLASVFGILTCLLSMSWMVVSSYSAISAIFKWLSSTLPPVILARFRSYTFF